MINSSVCITKYKGFDVAWLDVESKMQLLSVSDPDNDIVGSIYVGVVKHVMKNLNACFVEFLPDTLGFLSFNDADKNIRIVEGGLIPVQIVKEASKNKEAVLTMNLSLNGRYSIVENSNEGLCISKKITGDDRERIRTCVNCDNKYSIIVRTNFKNSFDFDALNSEINSLSQQLGTILDIWPKRAKYSCLYNAEPEYVRFIKGLPEASYERIITDDTAIYNSLSAYRPVLYDDEYSFIKLYSLQTKIEELLSKQIWLKGGGNIVIEYTEAMTVIDVNSAKNVSKKDRETLILKTNTEAALEIARQIRLRNISGIIVIDFINMSLKDNENELIKILKNELLKDNVRCDFVEFTKLGLMHIVRRKIKAPVYEILNSSQN